MAQQTKDDEEREDEDGGEESEGSSEAEPRAVALGGGELVKADSGDDAADAEGDDEEAAEDDDAPAATQLGADRYVLAGFFAAGMIGAYVLGRALETLWINASNKDWFSQNLPRLAAVSDGDKAMYTLLIGGIAALIFVARSYKKPDVRQWADDVAAELQKVVWPSRKDVTNSTFIVIVASTVATLYLTLLDRLWAFVTNIVYGDGS